jgi:hypothetical protein
MFSHKEAQFMTYVCEVNFVVSSITMYNM